MANIIQPSRGPIRHLNGSGRGLLEDYDAAYRAVRDAHDKVRQTAPHMRDYYPLPDGEEVYTEQRRAHFERLRLLEEVRDSLGKLMCDLSAQWA